MSPCSMIIAAAAAAGIVVIAQNGIPNKPCSLVFFSFSSKRQGSEVLSARELLIFRFMQNTILCRKILR